DLSGDGAAMALQLSGRLSGKDAVSLVVYDGLPQDSIIELDVAAVIQSTRSLVGRQISEMIYQIITDSSSKPLQVVWNPVFYPGKTIHPPCS
ncbi:TPA: transcriptional regulator, partial [Escherichia coli]|nr:transcriptional regulator [Escherichia coli]